MFHSMSTAASPPDRVYPLRVARIVDETADARSIVFEIPDALRDAFRYEPGQFLTLLVPFEGHPLKRCYSLSSCPTVDAEHKITVKRVAGGRISSFLVERLKVGDMLDVQAPAGRFTLKTGEGPIVLFAGGSGITPVLSIAKHALAHTTRAVRLVYANRDARSIIFDEELKALVSRNEGRFSVRHRLDDAEGFLQASEVRAEVKPMAVYYLCGPGPFMETVENGLLAAGAPIEAVHVERFVSAPDAPPVHHVDDGGDVPESIHVDNEGKHADVPYRRGITLLEAALEGGVEAPYSCREGFCGCCAAMIVEGTVKMDADDALTPDAKKRGLILACQSRPTSKRCSIKFVEY
jgi:3-ketosteroid 9alpha-monooxygenase subunit B